MLTKLFTYKSGIVITLIMAISSVYVCQVLCDFDVYNVNPAGRTTVFNISNQATSDHNENHSFDNHQHDLEKNHQHHSVTNNDHEKQTNHHPSQAEDCCEEMTNSIFNSLITQKIGIPTLEAKLFLVFEIKLSAFQATYNNLFTENFKFYSDSSPPILIGGIYIFVQSFLL